jgi:hypothetical protein
MFREMRRGKQLLSMEDTIAVMTRCTNGVLACSGDDGYPYAVPLSYVYFNGRIYFHSAKAGHKIDAITKNPKVSFSVIDEDKIVSEEYTTYFRRSLLLAKQESLKVMSGLSLLRHWLKSIQEINLKKPGIRKYQDANKLIL